MSAALSPPAESSPFALPRKGWWRHHARSLSSWLLFVGGVIAVVAGLTGAVRRVDEFQRLDFQAARVDEGFLVLWVQPRSGAARAGLAWGDTIIEVDGEPLVEVDDLERVLYGRNVSILEVVRNGTTREIGYYPPVARIDVQYLLVAFAAMFTLVIAALVYLAQPTSHSGRFLALGEAMFAAVAVPFPDQPDMSWQWLLLVRDFGRLALPVLLVTFFANFPSRSVRRGWLWLAFLPSVAVAAARMVLAAGIVSPVVGDVLLPEALDQATAVLVFAGILAAAAFAVRAYFVSRDDPTRRRQVEWVALGAAAGFLPYLLLTLIPQWAGPQAEVLTWLAVLPLVVVPLGVASSLLEFRLWDLEDISRHVISTGAVLLLGGLTFALLNYLLAQVDFKLGNWRNLVAVAGGVLLVALSLPARRVLLEALERLQYRERLAARRALTTFAEEAVGLRDPATLLARLAKLLQDALAVDRVVTYLARGHTLHPSPEDDRLPALPSAALGQAFPSDAERPLAEAGLGSRFVMARDERVVGVVYCGRRFGQMPLGHGERRLVTVLAAQAALALENSLLLDDLSKQVDNHRLLEEYLERIFQFSAAGLLICDATGRVLRANERAAALLQRTPDGLVGVPLGDLLELPDEWHHRLPAGLAGVQAPFITNRERTGLLSTSALELESGRFDGRIVAVDDITDQLNLEQRLAEQERLAALGRLAGGLAHEVNTPVTGIASYAQLLRELTQPADPRAPLVEKLEEQSFRVARIVTNLLELARPSGFERALVDLAEVARDAVVHNRVEADGFGVEVTLAVDGPAVVAGNRVQLELVVHNLLRNALQATPAAGTVTVTARSDGNAVRLEIADTGPGVPPEMRARIFEPFFTTRGGRGGTGLGLAITRDIVAAHDGSIEVRENVPHGTVVGVVFPAAGETPP